MPNDRRSSSRSSSAGTGGLGLGSTLTREGSTPQVDRELGEIGARAHDVGRPAYRDVAQPPEQVHADPAAPGLERLDVAADTVEPTCPLERRVARQLEHVRDRAPRQASAVRPNMPVV